jgi:hypothetical protein
MVQFNPRMIPPFLVVAALKELRETVLMPRVADPKRWSLDTGGAPVSCVCGLNRVPEPQR